ncbi:MAG: hypothetical protein M9900_06690 [Flavobacteriales bacterium]|nr:hypothetical protein [Flavobacteriales bacterium]
MATDLRIPRPANPWACTAAPWTVALMLAALLCAASGAVQAQVAINTTGTAPTTPNAMLELTSTTQGLLVPRMTQSQRNSLAGPPDGTIVYQTDSVSNNPPGFYYWDASIPQWQHVLWERNIWHLGGNTGTTSADFLGTLNNMPLIFRITGNERARISENGEFQLYSTYPNLWGSVSTSPATEIMHVQGGVKLNGGSVGNNEGTIRYVPGTGGARGQFQGYVLNAPGSNTSVNGWKQIDNNFDERKLQETAKATGACQPPSNPALTAAAVVQMPRPWPIPGPTGGFTTLAGAESPYYSLWEDGRRQFLFRSEDLAAAGICPGPSNPIGAIAFYATSSSSASGRIHFLRFRMKNTSTTSTAAGFDNNALVDFSNPNPPEIPGPPTSYNPNHQTGFNLVTGWNVHGADGGVNFYWTGANLLLDAALDNQEWSGPSINYGSVQGYGTTYPSMISMYCDACGGSGNFTCRWNTAPLPSPPFYYPPTTPTNGLPLAGGGTQIGWGYVGGWTLTAGVSTVVCDGDPTTWTGGGPPSTNQRLPRVAFLAKYTGGGAAYDVGNYMVSQDGLMVGDAAWASAGSFAPPPSTLNFHGPGTLNAQRSVWSGTSLLSDYVFDLYYDNQARPGDAQAAAQYQRVPLKDLSNYVERERRLPNVDGRAAWNRNGNFSIDQITNQLWVAVEDQALYIKELNDRMDALKQYLVQKKLRELEKE